MDVKVKIAIAAGGVAVVAASGFAVKKLVFDRKAIKADLTNVEVVDLTDARFVVNAIKASADKYEVDLDEDAINKLAIDVMLWAADKEEKQASPKKFVKILNSLSDESIQFKK